MFKKPKHTPLSQKGWDNLPWKKQADIWISGFLPGWLIGLVVSMVFALIFAVGITSVIALAAWDLSWYWGVTSRALFGGFTALFALIIWTKS